MHQASVSLSRNGAERVIVQRHSIAAPGISLVVATEDVRAPTHWCISQPGQTLVVHLAGQLQRMESVFATGPSSAMLPSVGDIWVVPAGCAYAAQAQGGQVRFAEFHTPADRGAAAAARVGHRDAFLHQASVRAAHLVAREDDLARMALQALLQAVRLHIADALQPTPAAAVPSGMQPRGLSAAQRERVLEFIASSLHEDIAVAGLALAAGVAVSQFVGAFKASFGVTPWQYVLRARLQRARQQLEHSTQNVTAIALAAGFASPSHFATAFGRHFGMSPANYRRARAGDR